MLREAMRMTLPDFAAHLGISDRTVSKWGAGGESYYPRPDSQAVLDTALARSPDEAKARYAEAPGGLSEAPPLAAGIGVDSHKFLPVFIGVERVRQLHADMTTASADG
ncbi:helix-turn-helix domain-containing protein [Streptomyces sp. NPDC053726]|uniref:helix-turn-helix domain-containing protein n=1 Tax=Streptomyces sp. NPDC053726 TaxID=3365713 RepID=UPI0037D80247